MAEPEAGMIADPNAGTGQPPAVEPNQPAAAGQPAANPSAASQQPAGGGADAPPQERTDTVSRAELDKVIGERQAAKERARAVEAQLVEVNQKLGAMPDNETLKAFQDWQANRDAHDREKAIKAGDVEAIERKVREPLEKQVQTKDAIIQALRSQLTGVLRDQALKDAAVPVAHNPDQVVALLRERVRMVEDPATKEYRPQFLDTDGHDAYDGNGNRIADAKTFVGKFLALPDNANLVRATAQPGSGAKPQGGASLSPRNPDTITLDQFNELPEDERTVMARQMTPAQRRRMMNITEPSTAGFL